MAIATMLILALKAMEVNWISVLRINESSDMIRNSSRLLSIPY